MPKYNPMDMAYVLKMSKTGAAITPAEAELMQNINQAMLPEVAAGNVGILPPSGMGGQVFPQTGAVMTPAEAAMMQRQTFGAAATPAEIQRLMRTRGR